MAGSIRIHKPGSEESMRKVVNPCMCNVYSTIKARAFVKIVYEHGKLSLTGVIGPMKNGNCKGSAGQCVDEVRAGDPTDGWTREMVDKLCNIWDEWHLNDMRPYCEHQKELGWRELASKEVKLFHYSLTREAMKKKNKAEAAALSALKMGDTFTPSEEQIQYAILPYSIVLPSEICSADYEPDRHRTVERKTLGWLSENEHPEGILCKPCPVCGYGYGTAWLKEEVPQDVIDWLFSLPDTKVNPAWV